MPTLATMRISPPTGWSEFELITQAALRIKWESPNLQRNGRQGQPQAGVDIYGEDNLGRIVGVQCKNVTEGLTIGLVKQELENASIFEPPLKAFYIATTAPNDSKLQKEVRLLSLERLTTGHFPVGLFFWEDLIQDLTKNPSEFSKHYPQIRLLDAQKELIGPYLLSILDITEVS